MKRKWMAVTAGMIAIVITLSGAVYGLNRFVFSRSSEQVESAEEKARNPIQEKKAKQKLDFGGDTYYYANKIKTYLIMGTDASGTKSDSESGYHGGMADFLLLLVYDSTEKSYGMLHLNRDIMTEIPLMQEDGSAMASAKMQLCTAHWYGGDEVQSCENTVKVVSDLLGGIKIDGYYAIDMAQIPQINRAVGGVDVTIEHDFSKVDPSLKKGETVHLSDEQAYTFIHDRYGVGDEENISRMARQRQYMSAFIQKVKEKSKEDNQFGLKLFKQLEKKVVTNIKESKISGLADDLTSAGEKGVFTLEGKFKVGQSLGDGVEHVEFTPDPQSIISVMSELYSLERKEI